MVNLTIGQQKAIDEMESEILRAKSLHPGEFHNAHEGYAVILEEVRELENEVFFGFKKCCIDIKKIVPGIISSEVSSLAVTQYKKNMREECIQIAAMAIRFASELTEE